MNKKYNELIEKYNKLKSELEDLKNKIDNPFKVKWMNDLFNDLKNSETVEFFQNERDIYPEMSKEIREVYPDDKFEKIVIEMSDYDKVYVTDELEFQGTNFWFNHKSYVFKENFEIAIMK